MKKIALLLSLILLISSFAGCHSSVQPPQSATQPATEPSATEPKEEIYYCPAPLTKEIYCQMFPNNAEYWNPDDFWAEDNWSCLYRYYGMYNGYGIITRYTNITVSQDYTTTIAGFTFITHSSYLHACKDGKMIGLDEAYEQGLLTDEDIKSSYDYHMQVESICCPTESGE